MAPAAVQDSVGLVWWPFGRLRGTWAGAQAIRVTHGSAEGGSLAPGVLWHGALQRLGKPWPLM